jgi:hypothetical protein
MRPSFTAMASVVEKAESTVYTFALMSSRSTDSLLLQEIKKKKQTSGAIQLFFLMWQLINQLSVHLRQRSK